MHRFKILNSLGDGSFGNVFKVQDKETGEILAMKKFKRKYSTWEDAVGNPEVKALIQLQHPNIVKLKEVIRHDNTLYMMFELLDMDVYKLIKGRRNAKTPFNDGEVRKMMFQIVQGLAYVHKHGFFHRDLKPDNLLVHNNTNIKISDFGLVREIKSAPPFTEYISTRWYRAPECVLRSRSYNYPVDIFALGCIMAEFYLMRPIFPGASELDQLNKII